MKCKALLMHTYEYACNQHVIEQPKKSINIAVLVYDDDGRTDDDADSLDVTVSSPPVQPHKMPHVEMVKPAMTEAELLAAQKEALEGEWTNKPWYVCW